jgi:hypothetical protein
VSVLSPHELILFRFLVGTVVVVTGGATVSFSCQRLATEIVVAGSSADSDNVYYFSSLTTLASSDFSGDTSSELLLETFHIWFDVRCFYQECEIIIYR